MEWVEFKDAGLLILYQSLADEAALQHDSVIAEFERETEVRGVNTIFYWRLFHYTSLSSNDFNFYLFWM